MKYLRLSLLALVGLVVAPPAGATTLGNCVDVTASPHSAIADDNTDDSAAFTSAITAALDTSTAYHDGCVFVPKGTFDITQNGVFSFNQMGTIATVQGGIAFRGEGINSSVIKLRRTSGTVKWLFDNTAPSASARMNRATFSDIWFTTDGAGDATAQSELNGFRLWGSSTNGWENGFSFRRVRFDYFGKTLMVTGTAGTEGITCHLCRFSGVDNALVLENDQSKGHTFLNTYIEAAYGDAFWVKNSSTSGTHSRGGGGSLSVKNASIILENRSGDTNVHYTIRIDDGADFNGIVEFKAVRQESRQATAGLVYWPGTANVTSGKVIFADSDLSTAQGSSREAVVLGPHKRLSFVRCAIHSNYTYTFANVSTGTINTFNYGPEITFDSCMLPPEYPAGIQDYFTLSSGYGRVIANNCTALTMPSENQAIDFDYNGDNPQLGDLQRVRRRANIFPVNRGWPSSTAGSERTVLLPQFARIVGVHFQVPPQGNGSGQVQYFVGSDDKSIVYASSTLAAVSAGHRADASIETDTTTFPVDISTTTNLQRVRLWQSPTHAQGNFGGYAYVEYE